MVYFYFFFSTNIIAPTLVTPPKSTFQGYFDGAATYPFGCYYSTVMTPYVINNVDTMASPALAPVLNIIGTPNQNRTLMALLWWYFIPDVAGGTYPGRTVLLHIIITFIVHMVRLSMTWGRKSVASHGGFSTVQVTFSKWCGIYLRLLASSTRFPSAAVIYANLAVYSASMLLGTYSAMDTDMEVSW